MIVPDVLAAQNRMEQLGVTIVKKIGDEAALNSPVAEAFGLGSNDTSSGEAELENTIAGIAMIGFSQFLLVEDPDGNLIEIQQQN